MEANFLRNILLGIQAHKFPLAMSSPVLHKVLYELDEESNPDKRLKLDESLNVTLGLVQCFDYVRLDVDGIPPIAMEALLQYVYKDKYVCYPETGKNQNCMSAACIMSKIERESDVKKQKDE